ncbi:MAG: metallophosphoesterase [Gallionella sp.]
MTRKQIATRCGVPDEELDYLLANHKTNDAFNPCPLPDALELSGDFIIVGDVHVPYTDYEFAQLVGRVADKTGIRRLIVAGDFFDMENWSKYEHAVQPATWVQERTAAKILLSDWLEVFTEIYTLEGNHDRRLAKFTHGALQSDDTWSMISTSDKLHHSKMGWCTVNSAGIPWRPTHPSNYGRNQLTVASDLANKYQTNIIGFHEHQAAMGWDVYGRFCVVNGGCLVDPRKLAYVSLDDSRAAGMKPGFVVLRGGVATVLGRYPFTNWDDWLN